MAGNRQSRPLYEFMKVQRDRSGPTPPTPGPIPASPAPSTGSTTATSTPAEVLEPKPPARNVERVESMSAFGRAPLPDRATKPPALRPVVLTPIHIGIGIAGVILLCLVVWYLGVHFGSKREELAFQESYQRDSADQGPQPTSENSDSRPGTTPASTPGSGTTPPATAPNPKPDSGPVSAPVPSRGSSPAGGQDPRKTPTGTPPGGISPLPASLPDGAVFSAKGLYRVDPRESGLNYLALGRFDLEDAQGALNYLAANGVDAIAVHALDRGEKPSKNPALYDVFLLQGITKEQFRAKDKPPRSSAESLVRRLGVAWQKQGGPSDFRQPAWVRFGGPP